MNVAVIGAGVAGITTADALRRAGHEVTVYEQQQEAALGSTFANAGQLSYSFCDAMPSPSMLWRLIGALSGRDSGVKARLSASPSFFKWGLGFIRECTQARYQQNSLALLQLAQRSAREMQRYHDAFGHEYSTRQAGKLVLLESLNPTERVEVEQALDLKRQHGCRVELLDREAVLAREPALQAWQGSFAAAIYSSNDEVGDARRFTQALARRLQQDGVQICYDAPVGQIDQHQSGLKLLSQGKWHVHQAVVLCTGSVPAALKRLVPASARVYPVLGYSIDFVANPHSMNVSVTDQQRRIVFSRMGESVRVAGYADVNLSHPMQQQRVATLLQQAQSVAPQAADYEAVLQRWVGRRPMSTSSVPYTQATKTPGLFVNLGHGMLGWTLAAGSAAHLVKLMQQTTQRTFHSSKALTAK